MTLFINRGHISLLAFLHSAEVWPHLIRNEHFIGRLALKRVLRINQGPNAACTCVHSRGVLDDHPGGPIDRYRDRLLLLLFGLETLYYPSFNTVYVRSNTNYLRVAFYWSM